MAATLTDERFTDPAWTFERKLDGIRAAGLQERREGRALVAQPAAAHANYPAVAEAIAKLPVDDADPRRRSRLGLGPAGQGRLPRVRRAVARRPRPRGRCRSRSGASCCATCRSSCRSRVVAELDGEQPWERACREGWEGVIAKRRDSPYESPPLAALAQDEVRGDAGAGDRRLHRSAGRARRPRRAAGRLLREATTSSSPARSAPASTRSCCTSLRARLDTLAIAEAAVHEGRPACRSCGALGAAARSSCRWPSRSGRRTASCATRACSASGPTRRRARW